MLHAGAKHVILEVLGMCHWFPELNHRRAVDKDGNTTDQPAKLDASDPKTKELIASIRDRGYDPQYPCVIGDITDDLKVKAVEILTGLYNLYKAAMNQPSTKPEDYARLAAFEYWYTKPAKKGKDREIIVPEYLGCTGNRRSFCVFEAGVQRLLLPENAQSDPFNNPGQFLEPLKIFAIHEHFDDTAARTIRQLAENTAKTEGFKTVNVFEVLYAVKHDVETGRIKQKDLREVYKDGEGQKMHGFLTMNARFPNLKLFERLRLPEKNPKAIIWGKLPQGQFAEIVRRSDSMANDAWNAKEAGKAGGGKPEMFADEKAVDEWFDGWRKPKTNEQKMMAKDTIQGLQKSSTVSLFRELLTDVLTMKMTNIDRITNLAPTFNAVNDLSKSPVFNKVSSLLTDLVAITDEVERTAYVDYLVSVATAYKDSDLRAAVLAATVPVSVKTGKKVHA